MFLVEWLFTLFSRGFSFEVTLGLWDVMLFYGELGVFRIGVAIIELIGPKILELGYEEAMEVVRNCGENVDESKLLELVSGSKLSRERMMRSF